MDDKMSTCFYYSVINNYNNNKHFYLQNQSTN